MRKANFTIHICGRGQKWDRGQGTSLKTWGNPVNSSELTLKSFVRIPERAIGPVEQQGAEVNPHPAFFQKS